MDETRVAIVCATELTRQGLKAILQARALIVSTVASSASDLLSKAPDDDHHHIILIAGPLERSDADQWIALKERFPHVRIVLSVEEFSIDLVTQALEQGIDGLLTEDMSCDQITASLRLIAMGERVVSSVILKQLLEHQRVRPSIDEQSLGAALSSRELEILKCLVAGDANKVISRRLGITDATVKVHVKSILRKLNVANRTQAAIWAVVRGLSRLEIVARSA